MDTTLRLPATLQDAIDEAIARAVGERWASRVWARDTSLWTVDESTAASIRERLGWLDAPTAFVEEVAELTAFGEHIEQDGYSDALVLGAASSTIPAEVLTGVFPGSERGLRLHVLDSTDPAAVAAFDDLLDPARTLRVVVAKSGVALETSAFLAHQWEREEHRVGRFPRSKAGNGFVAVSDPGGALDAIPNAEYFREAFLEPRDVGGRYGALTNLGLVPAALLQLDLEALLEDARIVAEATRVDSDENPALLLGVALAAFARAGRDKLTFVIEPDLEPLGPWLEQLIAGSTARAAAGIVPVMGEALGSPEAYGRDRVFVRLGPASDDAWHGEVDARLGALVEAGHPLIDIRLDDASWVGAEFFRWQFAMAVAGIGLQLDPFAEAAHDEPVGGEAERHARALLDHSGRRDAWPEAEPTAALGALRAWKADDDGQGNLAVLLREHLEGVPEGGYLHLGAWIAPSDARSETLRAVQARLRDATARAVTVGYGPRYLHTSGRLHKGGSPVACFILLTSGHPADMTIPGRGETFGRLIDAQAMGEMDALKSHELEVLRIDLGPDVDAGLHELGSLIDAASP